jgi:hypothetical protein
MVGSLLAGVGVGSLALTGLRGMLIDTAVSAGVTASYQAEVRGLYKEMGMEEAYGMRESLMAVGADVVLPVGFYGAGRAISITTSAAVGVVTKTAAMRNKYADSLTPEKISELAELDALATKKVVDKAMPSDAPPGVDEARVNKVVDAAAGNEDISLPIGSRPIDGSPPPSMLDKAAIEPTRDIATPMSAARALDDKPFNARQVRLEVADQLISQIEADISLKISEITPLTPAAKKVLQDTVDAPTTTPSAREAAQRMLARQAERVRLQEEIARLKRSRTIPSAYSNIVKAGVSAAREEHALRAKLGPAAVDEGRAQISRAAKATGALPDNSPPTLPSRPAPEPFTTGLTQGDDAALAKLGEDPDKVMKFEELDGTVHEMTARTLIATVEENLAMISASNRCII